MYPVFGALARFVCGGDERRWMWLCPQALCPTPGFPVLWDGNILANFFLLHWTSTATQQQPK